MGFFEIGILALGLVLLVWLALLFIERKWGVPSEDELSDEPITLLGVVLPKQKDKNEE